MQLKESEIIHAERLLAKAHQTMDLDVIESLLHNDYIVVQPGGELESKEDILRSFKSGKRYWDKAGYIFLKYLNVHEKTGEEIFNSLELAELPYAPSFRCLLSLWPKG